jgi:transposase
LPHAWPWRARRAGARRRWLARRGELVIPYDLTLLPLPPYSPKLNPIENVWELLRKNHLANRVFDICKAVLDACCTAWNALITAPEQIASITTRA